MASPQKRSLNQPTIADEVFLVFILNCRASINNNSDMLFSTVKSHVKRSRVVILTFTEFFTKDTNSSTVFIFLQVFQVFAELYRQKYFSQKVIGQKSSSTFYEKSPFAKVEAFSSNAANVCLLKMTHVKDMKGTSSRQVQKMVLKQPLTNYPVNLTSKHLWNAFLSSYKRRPIAY